MRPIGGVMRGAGRCVAAEHGDAGKRDGERAVGCDETVDGE